MHKYFVLFLLLPVSIFAQTTFEQKMRNMPVVQSKDGVTLSFDEPEISILKPTKIIIYALPNGNTTLQTFGKKLAKGDDWHFDIQHIGAQTSFIRNHDQKTNYILIYLENSLKSWPLWRRQIKNADSTIQLIVENIYKKYEHLKPKLTLCAHSGGGSFIFGFINAKTHLPNYVERLGFLDASYSYETDKHQQKISTWLAYKGNSLQVFAYNDSVVVYNGKPLVSPTGGTWYKSKQMANDLVKFQPKEDEKKLIWADRTKLKSFLLIKNPEAKILHTVLVEKNGLIHTIFNGTKLASRKYQFWDKRAYENFILE